MLIGTGDDESGPGLLDAMQAFNLGFKQLRAQGYGPVTSTLRKPRLLSSSQHVIGTAADFAIPPGQVPGFVRAAQQAGLIAVNEMTRELAKRAGSLDWTGPHMHVQLFPRGVRPPRPPVQLTEAP